jgi:hypothetical protein
MPVLDAAECLGVQAAPATEERPLIRLALTPPVAIAVDGLPSLHRLRATGFTPIAEAGLFESVTRLGGEALVMYRPAAMAAPARGGSGP